ncbi:unnamed protein product [Coffea canephora]|uniref:Uncharacterized protein n=1 Tax=Coffea canephora TaxID=49390 RepID=A0A068TTK3_COFCA|nr:unnamed protein product [Coffea canephora]
MPPVLPQLNCHHPEHYSPLISSILSIIFSGVSPVSFPSSAIPFSRFFQHAGRLEVSCLKSNSGKHEQIQSP